MNETADSTMYKDLLAFAMALMELSKREELAVSTTSRLDYTLGAKTPIIQRTPQTKESLEASFRDLFNPAIKENTCTFEDLELLIEKIKEAPHAPEEELLDSSNEPGTLKYFLPMNTAFYSEDCGPGGKFTVHLETNELSFHRCVSHLNILDEVPSALNASALLLRVVAQHTGLCPRDLTLLVAKGSFRRNQIEEAKELIMQPELLTEYAEISTTSIIDNLSSEFYLEVHFND